MANIAISELQTTADTLENEDLILVSKNDGSSFTSAKMKGSVLKSQVGGCQFTDAKVINDCETAIINKNVLTNSDNSNSISVLNEKLDSLITEVNNLKASQNTNFNLLIDLDTRIGNKVFGQSGGEIGTTEYTLTLNKDGGGSTGAPTGGGKYKTGTRVVITAAIPADGYEFDGWYHGGALISTDYSYSWEVTSDITLTAKYGVIFYHQYVYVNIVNNSSYSVATGDTVDKLQGYCDVVESGKSNSRTKFRSWYTIEYGSSFCYNVEIYPLYNYDQFDNMKLTVNDTTNWETPTKTTLGSKVYWSIKWKGGNIPSDKVLAGVFTVSNK